MQYIIFLIVAIVGTGVGFSSSLKAGTSKTSTPPQSVGGGGLKANTPSNSTGVYTADLAVTSVKLRQENKDTKGSGGQVSHVSKGSNSKSKDVQSTVDGKSKKPLKLSNVRLVVEDVEDTSQEKLVPVDPVVLRQKPSNVPIVEGERKSLTLPQGGKTIGGRDGIEGEGDDLASESKPILVVSALREEAPPMMQVGSSGVSPGFSPFNPPPPGAFPSTLTQRETLNVGQHGAELLPLPPVSVPTGAGEGLSSLDPTLPPVRVARAVAVDPNINAQFGYGMGGQPNAYPSPVLAGGRSGNQAGSITDSFYTDSESNALLHMATETPGFDGPASSVFGQMW